MNTTDPTAHPLGSVIAYVTHPAAGAKLTIVPLPGARPEVEGKHLAALGRICAELAHPGEAPDRESALRCCYCEQPYQSSRDDAKAHCLTCPSHPMRAVERERHAAAQRADAAERERDEERAMLRNTSRELADVRKAMDRREADVVRLAESLAVQKRELAALRDAPASGGTGGCAGGGGSHPAPAALLPFDADKVARECCKLAVINETADHPYKGVPAIAAVLRALPVAKAVDAEWLAGACEAFLDAPDTDDGDNDINWCRAYLASQPAALPAPAAPAPLFRTVPILYAPGEVAVELGDRVKLATGGDAGEWYVCGVDYEERVIHLLPWAKRGAGTTYPVTYITERGFADADAALVSHRSQAPAAPAPTGTPTVEELAAKIHEAYHINTCVEWECWVAAARVALALCAPAKRVTVDTLVREIEREYGVSQNSGDEDRRAVLTRHAGETITADTAKEARP